MDEKNRLLIEKFYRSFAQKDAEGMVSCYADNVTFEDPAFGQLHGEQARDMWRMLIARGKEALEVTYSNIEADAESGSASWEAKYLFSKTGRPVHNRISAQFKFEQGKITWHKDEFNLWRWSAMALGWPGILLGFTPMVKNKIRQEALKGLTKFSNPKD